MKIICKSSFLVWNSVRSLQYQLFPPNAVPDAIRSTASERCWWMSTHGPNDCSSFCRLYAFSSAIVLMRRKKKKKQKSEVLIIVPEKMMLFLLLKKDAAILQYIYYATERSAALQQFIALQGCTKLKPIILPMNAVGLDVKWRFVEYYGHRFQFRY